MKHFKVSNVVVVTLVGIAAYVGTFLAAAFQSTEPFADVAEQTMPKTVMLHMVMDKGQYLCAGVLVSPKGHILTCNHCVDHEEITTIAVTDYAGMSYFGEVLSKDSIRDLALLKINDSQDFPYAQIADPRNLKVGQEVIAIGYPLGLDWTVTHGIISQLHRDFTEGTYNRLQTDTFINPGNSGGPLFNRKGELVGVNSFIYAPIPVVPFFIGIGFSVEAGQLIEFLTKFRQLDKSLPRSVK